MSQQAPEGERKKALGLAVVTNQEAIWRWIHHDFRKACIWTKKSM